jgi:PTS system galactitol-specific IIC component
MEFLAAFFQGILDLGSYVFMPLVVTIIGLVVGLKPGKAFSSGLMLGVAICGINLVVSYMSTSVGTPVQAFVEETGLELTALDMGWAPALGLVWSWRYVFIMFVVQIGINVLMLLIKKTDTLNVDMWNVANQGFTAFLIYCVTAPVLGELGGVISGFTAGGIQVILELKNSDATKYQIQELTGCPGIGMPHPMFLSNVIFYPVARLLDKVFPDESRLDCAALQEKIGIFGENHIIGFILGTVIGLIAGEGAGAFGTGVMAGTALTLFPMVSKLFMTALTPISEAASEWVQKRFPGRTMVIGLDWPILAGNSEIWVAVILTIPVALGVSLVLPGNTVLPFGNLMNVCVCAAAFIPCRGDLRKMIIISWLMVPILCWSASDFAPMLTQLANEVGGTLPEGGMQLAWWGMDIAEIRWAAVEACRGNIGGIAALIGYFALCFPYFKNQKNEEKAAAERMGVEYLQ